MPIYAFECTDCGHSFDRLQKLSDPDPTDCPACAQASLRRQLTAPSFRLSGSGWYETDFKKEGDKKRNLADSGDGGGKGEAVKSDAGSAATPESGGASKPAAAEAAKPAASTPVASKPAASTG
jgi:putative FmdB family regulatory protein